MLPLRREKINAASFAGYIIAQIITNEAEILSLAVAPLARRRGVGAVADLAQREAYQHDLARRGGRQPFAFMKSWFRVSGHRPYRRPGGAVDAVLMKCLMTDFLDQLYWERYKTFMCCENDGVTPLTKNFIKTMAVRWHDSDRMTDVLAPLGYALPIRSMMPIWSF